mmetsp:Transcript_49805/g.143321  ORF Transcript_49805/g.143321 Transcript_49805/m.143321 type:complete len:367 (-) Transcript_49805:272-1372(-)
MRRPLGVDANLAGARRAQVIVEVRLVEARRARQTRRGIASGRIALDVTPAPLAIVRLHLYVPVPTVGADLASHGMAPGVAHDRPLAENTAVTLPVLRSMIARRAWDAHVAPFLLPLQRAHAMRATVVELPALAEAMRARVAARGEARPAKYNTIAWEAHVRGVVVIHVLVVPLRARLAHGVAATTDHHAGANGAVVLAVQGVAPDGAGLAHEAAGALHDLTVARDARPNGDVRGAGGAVHASVRVPRRGLLIAPKGGSGVKGPRPPMADGAPVAGLFAVGLHNLAGAKGAIPRAVALATRARAARLLRGLGAARLRQGLAPERCHTGVGLRRRHAGVGLRTLPSDEGGLLLRRRRRLVLQLRWRLL